MSFCAAVFTFGFTSAFRIESIYFFVFFSTLFVYNAQRFYKIQFTDLVIETPRIRWMKDNHQIVKPLILLGLLGTLYFGIPILIYSTFSFVLITVCFAVSVLYVLRLGNRNLREIPGMKVFLITLVYFLIACILPFQSAENFQIRLGYNLDGWIVFLLFQYLYVLGITILFDLPDIENDSRSMKTIPQIVGPKWAIVISKILILPFFILLIFRAGVGHYVWLLLCLHIPFYFLLEKRKSNPFYLSFFGEMMLLLNGVMYLLLS